MLQAITVSLMFSLLAKQDRQGQNGPPGHNTDMNSRKSAYVARMWTAEPCPAELGFSPSTGQRMEKTKTRAVETSEKIKKNKRSS